MRSAGLTLAAVLTTTNPLVAGGVIDDGAAGVIDLAGYWPNPQMQRTHYLKGTQGSFRIRDTLDPDNALATYRIFTLVGGSGQAFDTFVIFADSIALIASAGMDSANGMAYVWQYAPPYPSFPRFLDVSTLPTVAHQPASPVTIFRDGVPTVESTVAQDISITRNPDGTIQLAWADEIMTIGSVPIEGTGLYAPGLVRYQAPRWGIDSVFMWAAK